MASSSHVPNVSITVLLQALATPGAGFGTVTLLVDDQQGTGNPLDPATNGGAYLDFADADEAQAARDANYISAEVLEACDVAFSQVPAPSKFRVARVDTGSTDANIGDTYQAVRGELSEMGLTDLYCFCLDSRDGAEIEAFVADLDAASGNYICIGQSSDTDWLAGGYPAAFADLEEGANACILFHDDDAEWLDVGHACQWLAWDPDETSAPGENRVRGVAAYTSTLTSTQRQAAIDNGVGVLGTWGSTDYWLDNAVTMDGRPIYEHLTAAWFEARTSEDIQTMHQREHAAGRKVLVAPVGQGQVASVVKKRVAQGEENGHFSPGQTRVTKLPITDADRTARRIRVQVEAQVGIAARQFTVNAYLSQTPVIETA